MKTKRIFLTIISFLLLIPFRLPISVLLIKLLNNIAQIEGTILSSDILAANVIVTKLVYDITLSALLVYNIEKQTIDIKGRKAKTELNIYVTTGLLIAFLFCYIIFDCVWTYDLFHVIH